MTSNRSVERSGARDAYAAQLGQLRRRAGERDLDRLGAEVAQLGQRALVHQPAGPEDPDAVAQRLDLAEDVGGEEHRLAALLGLGDAVAKRHLHQRIEAAGGLVEQQQVGACSERRDQLHLLAVALRQRAHLLAGVELEALDQRVPIRAVGPAVQPREELERLRAGQRRPQERLAGDVGDAAVRRHRLAPGVDPEQLGATRGRPVQAEQQPDRRRLARAVRPEVAVHLALGDLKVERVERERVAVALGQLGGADGGHLATPTLGARAARWAAAAQRRWAQPAAR